MKSLIPVSFLLFLSTNIYPQDLKSGKTDRQWFYPTASLVTGFPLNDFKQNVDKKILWGFNLEGIFIPFKNVPVYQPGFMIEMLFNGLKDDSWKGLDVTTESSFIHFNFTNKIRITEFSKVSPFIEGTFGLRMSSTQTNYEVIDRATFLEAFLLNEEDEIETHTAKSHFDFSPTLCIGIGCVINKIFIMQLKYNYGPLIEFVKKEDTIVQNNSITYIPTASDVKMIVLTLGFSFENVSTGD